MLCRYDVGRLHGSTSRRPVWQTLGSADVAWLRRRRQRHWWPCMCIAHCLLYNVQ